MVVLNKIYTRTGDGGETALSDGTRVAKHSLRVAAYGTVDETNATVGLARLHADGERILRETVHLDRDTRRLVMRLEGGALTREPASAASTAR